MAFVITPSYEDIFSDKRPELSELLSDIPSSVPCWRGFVIRAKKDQKFKIQGTGRRPAPAGKRKEKETNLHQRY